MESFAAPLNFIFYQWSADVTLVCLGFKISCGARTDFCLFCLMLSSAQPRGDCFPPVTPLLVGQQYPARGHLTDFTLERGLPPPYAIQRNAESSSNAGRLRSSSFNFAAELLGQAEFIRLTSFTCARGADRTSRHSPRELLRGDIAAYP